MKSSAECVKTAWSQNGWRLPDLWNDFTGILPRYPNLFTWQRWLHVREVEITHARHQGNTRPSCAAVIIRSPVLSSLEIHWSKSPTSEPLRKNGSQPRENLLDVRFFFFFFSNVKKCIVVLLLLCIMHCWVHELWFWLPSYFCLFDLNRIKPDGVQRGLVGDIIKRFEQKGFKLVALKFVQVRH